MTEFKHKIGESLYDLWEWDGFGPETIEFPIIKRTERYVYVRPPCYWDDGKLIRFSVAELEQDGRAWNAANRMGLHTRPKPDWPTLPAIVRKPEQLSIERTRP